jgi:hypothetical protein
MILSIFAGEASFMKRLLACIALMLGLGGTLATPAAADPPSSAEFQIPITCDGTTYMVGFIPGRGAFTPALVTTSTQVLVPIAFDLTFTDVTTGESEPEAAVKGPGSNPNAATCTIDFTATDPESGHVFNIKGTAAVLVTPVG